MNILSSSCIRVFYTLGTPRSFHLFFYHSRTFRISGCVSTDIRLFTFGDKFLRYFPFPFHLISLDRARLPLSLSTTSYSGTSSWLHSLLNNRRSPLSVSLPLFPVYESLHFPSSSLSTFQPAISMPPSYFTFAYFFDREFRSLSHLFLFSFTLPFFFLLLLSVSSLTRRALQAPQSYLVIQLFDVEKGEYPFSLSLRTLSVPSTCNHRGEQSLQSEREKRC